MKSLLQKPKCPNCNHPVKLSRVYFLSGLWVQWPCPECGSVLEFSIRRRLLYIIPLYAVTIITMYFLIRYNISPWWALLWVLITPACCYIERVQVAKHVRKPEL